MYNIDQGSAGPGGEFFPGMDGGLPAGPDDFSLPAGPDDFSNFPAGPDDNPFN